MKMKAPRRAFHVFACSTVLLLLLWAGSQARANEINNCAVGAATPGETMTCTFVTQPTPLLFIHKTFGATPGILNVNLGLGNNLSQIPTVYHVIETIDNTSAIDWTDFHITSPNASSLVTTLSDHWATCDSAILCSGGVVPAQGGNFTIFFDLGTPTDQTAGAFALFESPSTRGVPEPGSLLLLGSGLVGLAGIIRRRQNERKLAEGRRASEPATVRSRRASVSIISQGTMT